MVGQMLSPKRVGARSRWNSFDSLIGRWGWVGLLVFAVVYYGLYVRTGLNLGGEGGTNGVLALRLMEGQRPIVDTFLGYNLMWFYPIVAIFSVTGPDYVAMRIFFFVLCALTAVVGFGVVMTSTRQGWLALFVGTLMVLVPGMIFRNYMGLIAVACMFMFLNAYVPDGGVAWRRLAWMAGAGCVLGICYMVRIEPSMLLTVVWGGLIALYPLGKMGDMPRRLLLAVTGGLLGMLMVVAVHLPFFHYANKHGFGDDFTAQYGNFINLLRYELSAEWEKLQKAIPLHEEKNKPLQTNGINNPKPELAPNQIKATSNGDEDRDARRGRPALMEAFGGEGTARARAFVFMIHYPIMICAVFIPVGLVVVLIGIVKGPFELKQNGLQVLVGIGCALSLFPQYYFFRPDAPHLSEFMVAFLPAMAVSGVAIVRSAWILGGVFAKSTAIACALMACLSVPIYMKAIMPRESAGTIVKHGELVEFRALNGVNVKLPPADAKVMQGLRDAILSNSGEDDYVVVYPYSPTINFMTNRRSYEYNLYVDNATAGMDFQRHAIERLDKYRPAVIVIDNRSINGTEASRFMVWAGHFMNHLRKTYLVEGVYVIGSRENTVFIRDKSSSTNE